MKTSEEERLLKEAFEVINSHREDALDRFQVYLAGDMTFNNPVTGPTDKEGMRNFHSAFLGAFPDYYYSVDRTIPHDNTVVVECTFKGSHQGQLMAIPATNKHVAIPIAFVVDFEGNKIKRWQTYFDTGSLMRQLGVQA